MTVLAILQARVSSTRLPNRSWRPARQQPMLAARSNACAVRARSINWWWPPVTMFPTRRWRRCAPRSGSLLSRQPHDVLARFHGACTAHGPVDHVVRLTGDCPLADPAVIDRVVRHHLDSGADYTTNAIQTDLARWP